MTKTPAPRRMSLRKRWLFAILTLLGSTLTTVGVVVGLDVYLHRRHEIDAGLNVWGYRGPVAGRKHSGEQRIVVLGGSTAFGYGVQWYEAFPAVLERKLSEQRRAAGVGPVSVVNLAYNNEGAYSTRLTLRDYDYLNYDVALLYTGYNDLSGYNISAFRQDSPIFRMTGYVPILPLILFEKALVLRHGGNLEDAYRGKKTTFVPTAANRFAASALEPPSVSAFRCRSN